MSLFVRQLISWIILIAILWDTILTAILLRLAVDNRRRLLILEKLNPQWQPLLRSPTLRRLFKRDAVSLRRHLQPIHLSNSLERILKMPNTTQIMEYIGLLVAMIVVATLMMTKTVDASTGWGGILLIIGYIVGSVKGSSVANAVNNVSNLVSTHQDQKGSN